MKRLPIILHGSYYTDNFGDILLMRLFAGWLEEHPARPRVIVPFLAPTARSHTTVGGSGWRSVLRGSALVLGGGGYFSEPPGDSGRWSLRLLLRYSSVAEAFIAMGRPYAIIGVGVGPLTNRAARKSVVRLFSRAHTAAVRDQESLDYLREYGLHAEHVSVTADAALTVARSTAAPAGDPLSRPPHLAVAVHLSHPASAGGAHRLVGEELLAVLGDSPARVIAITDQHGARGQEAAAFELKEALGSRCSVLHYADPLRLVDTLRRVDAVITTKLHVGIVASALGRPVLSIPTHSKTPRFYRQIGRSEQCRPLVELRPGDAADAVQRLLGELPTNWPIPERLVDSAGKNRELLRRFVDATTS